MRVYGIATCGSVKKATTFLKNKNIDFEFVDFKKYNPTIDEDQYGYRGVEQDVKEGVTIYTQQVEDLDLVSVIRAVNKVDDNKITLVRQPMVFGAPGDNGEMIKS